MISNKNKNLKYSLLTLCLTSSAVSAGALEEIPKSQESPYLYVLTLSGGPVWSCSSNGQKHTIQLSPGIEKTYNPQNSSDTLGAGEIFFGLQKTFNEKWQTQFGLAIAGAGNAALSGEVWDDADRQFNNHTYSYEINHTHVAAKGKLLIDRGYWVTPWLSVSLGVGFNRAHSYENTPTIPEALPDGNFGSNTETSFTYTIGLGIEKAVTEHFHLGVGYEFSDWGSSELNKATGQTLNSGLSLDHFYTNGLLFNFSYLV